MVGQQHSLPRGFVVRCGLWLECARQTGCKWGGCRPPHWTWYLLPAAGTCIRASSTEAVTAIDWTVAAGPEGKSSVLATFGAHRRMHFTWALTVSAAAAATLVPSDLPTIGTALWFVGEAPRCMVGLVVCTKDEWLSTVLTCEGLILVTHRCTPFN